MRRWLTLSFLSPQSQDLQSFDYRIRCSTSEPHFRHQPSFLVIFYSYLGVNLLLTSQRRLLMLFLQYMSRSCAHSRLLSCGDPCNCRKWTCAVYTRSYTDSRLTWKQHMTSYPVAAAFHRFSSATLAWYYQSTAVAPSIVAFHVNNAVSEVRNGPIFNI